MNRKLNKLVLASAIATTMGFAGQANALLLKVSESGGWTGSDNANDSFAVPAPNNDMTVAPAGTFTEARWFTNSNPESGVDLNFFASTEDVPDNGSASYLIATVTQINNVLFEEDSDPAETFPYTHTLDFAADFGIFDGATEVFSLSPTGSVVHTETFNENGNVGNCAPPNPNASACDDIWNFIPGNDFGAFPMAFMIDNVWYDLSFDFVPGVGTQIVNGTVFTAEGENAVIGVVATITGQEHVVPEPATTALFGAGLLGLGATRLLGRKKSA